WGDPSRWISGVQCNICGQRAAWEGPCHERLRVRTGTDSPSRDAAPRLLIRGRAPYMQNRAAKVAAACGRSTGAMSGFDKREEGFEKKFAHDEELRFKAMARRNKLLGLWAAELLGLSGDAAAAYALE